MKKFIKKSLVITLILLIIAFPVLADNTYENISPWAYEYVSDSQYYGLIDLGKESINRNYKDTIEKNELDYLIKSFEKKMEKENLEENNDFQSINIEFDKSRKSVLFSLYNLLGKYDSDIDSENPIDYLKKEGILKGNGNDLGLDKEATKEESITFFVRGIRNLYKKNNLGGKGVFYKIENNENTVFLLGTIHMGKYEMYPLENSIIESFISSDVIIPELNLLDKKTIVASTLSQYRSDGTKLEDEIGKDLFEEVYNVLAPYGISKEILNTMENWAVLNNLTNIALLKENPKAPTLGIDMYLLNKAVMYNKEIKPIETVKTQVETLDNYYKGNSENLKTEIKETLDMLNDKKALDAGNKELNELMEVWKKGDSERLVELFESDQSSDLLVSDRDPKMAEFIKDLLESDENKTYFVMIGAGHLSPEGSVIDYLKDYGFIIDYIN